MPTYEFRCPNGHDFERFYKTISAAPAELECPDCGAAATRRLSGGAGLLFKGSGFYLTDYGKNAHRADAPQAKTRDGGGEPKGDASGAGTKSPEAKPAAGAPAKADSPTPKAGSTKPKAESPKKK